jgi:hypothetical protein
MSNSVKMREKWLFMLANETLCQLSYDPIQLNTMPHSNFMARPNGYPSTPRVLDTATVLHRRTVNGGARKSFAGRGCLHVQPSRKSRRVLREKNGGLLNRWTHRRFGAAGQGVLDGPNFGMRPGGKQITILCATFRGRFPRKVWMNSRKYVPLRRGAKKISKDFLVSPVVWFNKIPEVLCLLSGSG